MYLSILLNTDSVKSTIILINHGPSKIIVINTAMIFGTKASVCSCICVVAWNTATINPTPIATSNIGPEILNIVKENSFGIKFRYLPETLKELRKKRRVFKDNIPLVNFTKSQLRAMLNSGKLDEIARPYYEKKLIDPDNTPHPIDIIDHAKTILQDKKNIYISIKIWKLKRWWRIFKKKSWEIPNFNQKN